MRYISILLLCFLLSACTKGQMKIIPLQIPYEDTYSILKDSSGKIILLSLNFIIKNYAEGMETDSIIKNYSDSVRRKNLEGQLNIFFFKEPVKTNSANLSLNPKDFARHSLGEDMVYWVIVGSYMTVKRKRRKV